MEIWALLWLVKQMFYHIDNSKINVKSIDLRNSQKVFDIPYPNGLSSPKGDKIDVSSSK